MTASDLPMNPVAVALAETRAREAGLSTTSWLEQLVLQRGSSPSFYHGGGGSVPIPTFQSGQAAADFRRFGSLEGNWGRTRDLGAGPEHLDTDFSMAPNPEWGARVESSGNATNSALQMMAVFPQRIDYAAFLLSVAFVDGAVRDFRPPSGRRKSPRYGASHTWYDDVVSACIHRSREVQSALVHPWEPKGRAERRVLSAFIVLCDLTPAGVELVKLCERDRTRAFTELAKHLQIITQQFELSANLLTEVEAVENGGGLTDEQRFAAVRAALLEKASGGLSLTDAAQSLGMTRQALHKRIKSGSALGMMDGNELVLPKAQWFDEKGSRKFLPGLTKVLRLFRPVGEWSALQFLVDTDPNLATSPRAALMDGRIDEVLNAARAYLGMDEG